MLGDVSLDHSDQVLVPVAADWLLVDGRDECRPDQVPVAGPIIEAAGLGDRVGTLEQELEVPPELRGQRAGAEASPARAA